MTNGLPCERGRNRSFNRVGTTGEPMLLSNNPVFSNSRRDMPQRASWVANQGGFLRHPDDRVANRGKIRDGYLGRGSVTLRQGANSAECIDRLYDKEVGFVLWS